MELKNVEKSNLWSTILRLTLLNMSKNEPPNDGRNIRIFSSNDFSKNQIAVVFNRVFVCVILSFSILAFVQVKNIIGPLCQSFPPLFSPTDWAIRTRFG